MAAPDPEDLWLDLIDAEDSDDRDEQLRLAKRILKLDDTHVDAWWALAKLELPAQGAPTLVQASRCLRACKQVIELDIDHRADDLDDLANLGISVCHSFYALQDSGGRISKLLTSDSFLFIVPALLTPPRSAHG